jgi:hypothetical protein
MRGTLRGDLELSELFDLAYRQELYAGLPARYAEEILSGGFETYKR